MVQLNVQNNTRTRKQKTRDLNNRLKYHVRLQI